MGIHWMMDRGPAHRELQSRGKSDIQLQRRSLSAGRLGNNCNENGKKRVHNSALGRVVRKGKDWSRLREQKEWTVSSDIKGDTALVNGGDRWENSVIWFRLKQGLDNRIQNAIKDDKSQIRPCSESGSFLLGVRQLLKNYEQEYDKTWPDLPLEWAYECMYRRKTARE